MVLTCGVDEPGEGSVEPHAYFHVVVLAFRFNICKTKAAHNINADIHYDYDCAISASGTMAKRVLCT